MEKKTILLVDSNQSQRQAVCEALQQSKELLFSVIDAKSAAAALQQYREKSFDCVIMDYELVDMSGLEFVHQLHRVHRVSPPIIVITAHGNEQVAVELMKAGVADYLVKDEKLSYIKNLPLLAYKLSEKFGLDKKHFVAQRENSAILDAVADGVIGIYENGSVCFANRTACRLLQYDEPELLVGKSFKEVFNNKDHKSLSELINYASQVGAFETNIFTHGHSRLPVEVHCSVVHEKDSHIIVLSFRDITQRKRNEKELVRLAQYDSLTSLANRSLFIELLNQAISRANRSKYYYALLFIDLDDFKLVNDKYGHLVGDKLLQETAQRLKSCTRAHDTVARIGGDEFTVILEELHDEQDVFLICEKIKTSLSYPFIIQDIAIEVAASIGIVTFNDIHHDSESLLKFADTAMYSAKRQGSGHYEIFDQIMSKEAKELIHLRTALETAVSNKELFIEFQPIVNMKSGQCQGVEALLRWKDDIYGIIEPERFIPLAEEIGIINELWLWVLQESCEKYAKFLECVKNNKGEKPFRISINLSMTQIKPHIVSQIEEIFEQTNMDAKCIELEITESYIMSNPEHAIDILLKLKALGVGLAIDDFGTGYSSLSYLTQLPADRLKIDSSFIKKIPTDRQSVKVVQSIINLSHGLGLEVTAEGVENKKQLNFLKELNCEEAQGYYLSHPLLENELLAFLNKA